MQTSQCKRRHATKLRGAQETIIFELIVRSQPLLFNAFRQHQPVIVRFRSVHVLIANRSQFQGCCHPGHLWLAESWSFLLVSHFTLPKIYIVLLSAVGALLVRGEVNVAYSLQVPMTSVALGARVEQHVRSQTFSLSSRAEGQAAIQAVLAPGQLGEVWPR